jgi:hypothetical protein
MDAWAPIDLVPVRGMEGPVFVWPRLAEPELYCRVCDYPYAALIVSVGQRIRAVHYHPDESLASDLFHYHDRDFVRGWIAMGQCVGCEPSPWTDGVAPEWVTDAIGAVCMCKRCHERVPIDEGYIVACRDFAPLEPYCRACGVCRRVDRPRVSRIWGEFIIRDGVPLITPWRHG